MTETATDFLARYTRACARRSGWEAHWRECYEFAMPQRDGALGRITPGAKRTERLFDGTAADAVDQLAASLMAELTPPWARWFELARGPDAQHPNHTQYTHYPQQAWHTQAAQAAQDEAGYGPEGQEGPDGVPPAVLDAASCVLQGHFERSNFSVEIHQCFLDLVTVGTAGLLFEEAPIGEPSAFCFTAVPIGELVLEEDAAGRLAVTFRRSDLSHEQFCARFPREAGAEGADGADGEARYQVVEGVMPADDGGFDYLAVLQEGPKAAQEPEILARGHFARSPFIHFRWMKAPGEIYGRSPVMKALPDIKTANKVVELVLKNATIAVTGIWQAEDDGILNPATIKLTPGSIIPKAVGSGGLTPLSAPGRFDTSQLILDDLRQRIRRALLGDMLGQVHGPRMTATEVLERASEMTRLLGANFGRLQAELMMPLARRALAILIRRGEIPDLPVDGRRVDLRIVAPIAGHRKLIKARNAMQWLEQVRALVPEAMARVNIPAAVQWFAENLDLPAGFLHPPGNAQGADGAADTVADTATDTAADFAADFAADVGLNRGANGAADALAALAGNAASASVPGEAGYV